MINYKKADAYFAKQAKKGEVYIWRPLAVEGGGNWVADRYLAVWYYDRPLPFDPAVAKDMPSLEKIIANAVLAFDEHNALPFLHVAGTKRYQLFTGRKALRDDFASILGDQLKFYKQRSGGGLFVVKKEEERPVAFACEYLIGAEMWEVLGQ